MTNTLFERANRTVFHLGRAIKCLVGFAVLTCLGIIVGTFAMERSEDASYQVEPGSEVTYYLHVYTDGIDEFGVSSFDGQNILIKGNKTHVEDIIPDGMEFVDFVHIDGPNFGASALNDEITSCSGYVVTDSEHTEGVDSYYKGLHYDSKNRKVWFDVNEITAGCEITVGFIARVPSEVDIPSTPVIENRRDFNNIARISTQGLSSYSNYANLFIGREYTDRFGVHYEYDEGVALYGMPTLPEWQDYTPGSSVTMVQHPSLPGYKFEGWDCYKYITYAEDHSFSSKDIDFIPCDFDTSNGSFIMPDGYNVVFRGRFVEDESPRYELQYSIIGDIYPEDFVLPKTKSYFEGDKVQIDSMKPGDVVGEYIFRGWTLDGKVVESDTITISDENVELIGSFEHVTYNLCYAFTGTVLPENSKNLAPHCEKHYRGELVHLAGDPKAENYRFLGWYSDSPFEMPGEDLTIYGEWAENKGVFSPDISINITDKREDYKKGDVVDFEIVITNPEPFELENVFVRSDLPGVLIIESVQGLYEIKESNLVLVPKIPAKGTATIYAKAIIPENKNATYQHGVRIISAENAYGYAFNTDEDHFASVNYKAVASSPVVGIIGDIKDEFGDIKDELGDLKDELGNKDILGVLTGNPSTADNIRRFVRILTISILGLVACVFVLRYRLWQNATFVRYALGCIGLLAIVGLGVFLRNASAATDDDYQRVIELTSQKTSFSERESGAWKIDKSASWTGNDKAQIKFEVSSIAKNIKRPTDYIFVFDNSGSMAGEKIEKAKFDASSMFDLILEDGQNTVALISFNTDSTIEHGFTNNSAELHNSIAQLEATGSTNYYQALVQAEKLLKTYTPSASRDLSLIFLTDGDPNEETPSEIAEYELLKSLYPDMLISGVQYEMGSKIREPLSLISDVQYVATMKNLYDVLVTAATTPAFFDEFIIYDILNLYDWSLDTSLPYVASIGNVDIMMDEEEYDEFAPLLRWDLGSSYASGSKATLTINLILREWENLPVDARDQEESYYLWTNEGSAASTKIINTPNELVYTDQSPILKGGLSVTYDLNPPCGGPAEVNSLYDVYEYQPYSTVELIGEPENYRVCDDFIFNGWQIVEGEYERINNDYIRVLNDDILIRATWVRTGVMKDFVGTPATSKTATLDTGMVINQKLKILSGNGDDATHKTQDYNVNFILPANRMTTRDLENAVIVSSDDSELPIYAWYATEIENGESANIIYYYTDAMHVYMNEDASFMFADFRELVGVDLLSIDTSRTESLESTFGVDPKLEFVYGVENWDTSKVKTIKSLLASDVALTGICMVSGWDVSSVETFDWAFYNMTGLESLCGLEDWNTQSAKTFVGTFEHTIKITSLEPLRNWDVSNATDFGAMFEYADHVTSLEPLRNWDMSNATSLADMFWEDAAITSLEPLRDWDVSNVTTLWYTFDYLKSVTSLEPLSNWDVSNVESFACTFCYIDKVTSLKGLENWNTSKGNDFSGAFYAMTKLRDIDALRYWDVSNTTDLHLVLGNTDIRDLSPVEGWSTSKNTSLYGAFQSYRGASLAGLENWDTSKVTDFERVFRNNANITSLEPIRNWDVSSAETFKDMFNNDTKLTDLSPLEDWSVPSNAIKSGMFTSVNAELARPSWY